MKIAFVSEHASPLAAIGGVDAGGQNVHVAELAKNLAARGHQVTVFTRRDDVRLLPRVRCADGYVVSHLSAGPAEQVPKDDLWPYLPRFAELLREALDGDRPDIVHGHFWMSVWAARRAVADWDDDVPVVATFHALGWVKRRHQGEADTSPRVRRRIEPELVASVDRIVATCTDEVSELRSRDLPPAPISVVPCGVDVADFTPDGPVRGDRQQPRRIVALGRLVPRKGFATLIEALPRIADTELVIAGGGSTPEPERERLLELAVRLGVDDRLRMIPQVPRTAVPALLRSADLVVTVPWYEPFGIVPLEAMACGRPVVASAVGGMLDTVVPDRTGILVPPKQPAALADAVTGLLDDPDRRERYGRTGAAWVRSRFTWDHVAQGTLDAYHRTLEVTAQRRLSSVGA